MIKFLPLLCLIPLWGCSSGIPVEDTYLTMKGPHARAARFEPSGLAHQGENLFVFNDKNDEPPVYLYHLQEGLFLIENIPLRTADGRIIEARKFEDASASNRGSREIYAVTSYDRPDPAYNRLIKISPRSGGGWSSEELPELGAKLAELRERLNTPYMKIEAFALSRDDRAAYVGVREIGPSYKEPSYVVMIWKLPIVDGGDPLEKVLEVDTVKRFGRAEGISALEYDGLRKRYLMLTSYEGESIDALGGHLWAIPEDLLEKGTGDCDIEVLRSFLHKPEGVAVTEDGRIVVVFDDDSSRKEGDPERADREGKFNVYQNEAFYSVFE
ncbi:MAG: hypothetical protein C0623_12840 [Desulfuromonas sp.]|nr:MAG: hypothetical protein C0623_12840 [Desulfuromonas sp.]